MFDLDFWNEIWEVITKNRIRSLLTALGVFWGLFMLIFMSGFGSKMERTIQNQVNDFAVNSVFMFSNKTTEPYGGFRSSRTWSFSNSDIDYIRKNAKGAQYVCGILFGNMANASRGEKSNSFSMMGQMPEYVKIEPMSMLYGRYINDEDMRQRRKVCTIGQRVYETLFKPGEDPIGKIVKVNASYYTVIGVNIALSSINIGPRTEETITIPFSTMQQLYNMGDKFSAMTVAGDDHTDATQMQKDIEQIVRSRHVIAPTDKKAIMAFNMGEQFSMFSNMLLGITVLIWIVGAGTLFAGIVGISNIMLVVTKERTHEIGIRRAMGATPKVIRRQIICESFVLTLMAGIAGIAFSVGILSLVDMAMGAQTEIGHTYISAQASFKTVMSALAIVVFGGVAAGLIPANKAIEIKAVEALREE